MNSFFSFVNVFLFVEVIWLMWCEAVTLFQHLNFFLILVFHYLIRFFKSRFSTDYTTSHLNENFGSHWLSLFSIVFLSILATSARIVIKELAHWINLFFWC